jgi:hypothetical protein
MNRTRAIKTISLRLLATSLCLAGVLCLGACGSGADAEDGFVVSYTTEALMSGTTSGGASNACLACGCTYQYEGRDENGCRVYRCVCDSQSKADCVTSGGPKKSLTPAVLAR